MHVMRCLCRRGKRHCKTQANGPLSSSRLRPYDCNILLTIHFLVLVQVVHVQAFSPVGRCKTFDASADGYGRGEGCAAIVMKPQENGEPASNSLAVLKASATNQDGRSSSLTAPNGPSQAALIRTAVSLAGDPLHCLLQSPYSCGFLCLSEKGQAFLGRSIEHD